MVFKKKRKIEIYFSDSEDGEPEEPPKKKSKQTTKPTKEPVINFSGLEMDSIRTLGELIHFAKFLERKYRRRKKIGLLSVTNCIEELESLNNMIGLENLKLQVTQQLMFFLMGLNKDEMMHTVISGPPGMAKTTAANKLARIYAKLGFLSEGHVINATRADMVGQFLGETSLKTRDLLEHSRGGVLLIDEAYSLGSKDGRDSFSAECINTINQFLSENSEDFMCIIAGYEKELRTNFFSANPGLERRFPWWFRLNPYTEDELADIFFYQIRVASWTCEETVTKEFVKKILLRRRELFSNNGGDTLIFFDKCKVAHSRRVFLADPSERKILTRGDINEGYDLLRSLKKSNGSKKGPSDAIMAMYL
uniref:AAA+ ATPase domain-containing protein n=1 Tax=viral metagenome TaxID=1070528 RepID=A0A6C0KBS6_9ZZZZ